MTLSINSVLDFLNNIGSDFSIQNKKLSKNRNKKLTIQDVFLFSLLYTQLHTTQESISNKINCNKIKRNMCNYNTKFFYATSITSKLDNINIDVFKNIYNHMNEYYENTFNKHSSFLAVDGVYNNTNILHNNNLETNMNLCIYDVKNNYPIDIIFSDVGKKNNEIKILTQQIENNLNYFNNKCLICDRAYFSYALFEYLHKNNIKYIIRVKQNISNKTIEKYDNMRIVKRAHVSKQYEKIIIATNLLKTEYSDNSILKLYGKRWNIEEYFKHLKKNNKFQNITLHTKERLFKHYYSIEIINKIKHILLELYKYKTNYKEKTITNKNGEKLKTHINENIVMDVLYDEFLYDIVYGTFDEKALCIFINSIKINKNIINVHNERISKTPFTKWYIKGYHNKQNNINEQYSKKYKTLQDPVIKQELKRLIKEESNIKAKRKTIIANINA